MKSFKQYILESNEFSTINNVLQKYINGEMPDYFDNEQSNPKDLFKQIYEVFQKNNINLIIIKDGKRFDGTGIVLKTDSSTHFDLASETEDNIIPQKFHIELKKNANGYYFLTTARIESK